MTELRTPSLRHFERECTERLPAVLMALEFSGESGDGSGYLLVQAGDYYNHGGVSLQECLTPELIITRKTNIKMIEIERVMNQANKTVFDTDFVSIFGTKISSLYKDAVEYQQVLPDLTLARFRQILELWCADLAKKNSLYGVEELSLCEFINFLYSEHVFNRDIKG